MLCYVINPWPSLVPSPYEWAIVQLWDIEQVFPGGFIGEVLAYLPKHFFSPAAKIQNIQIPPVILTYLILFSKIPQVQVNFFSIPPSALLKLWQFLKGKGIGTKTK